MVAVHKDFKAMIKLKVFTKEKKINRAKTEVARAPPYELI